MQKGLVMDCEDAANESDHATEALTVRLPPPQPIVNELLCFVQNKVEVLPLDVLVRICTEFYSYEIISAAKDILFQTAITRQRKIQRKHNKSKTSLEDIVKVFLEMEMTNAPIYVARNLAELPPFSADIGDSLKVLTEIETIKLQIKLIESNQLKMMHTIKNERETNTQPKYCDTIETDVLVMDEHTRDQVSDDSDHKSDVDRKSACEETNGSDFNDADFPTLGRQAQPQPTGIWQQCERNSKSLKKVKSRTFTRQPIDKHVPPKSTAKLLQGTSRTTTRTNHVVIGNGTSSTRLRCASERRSQAPSQHRQCTGLFLSRLHPHSTVAEVGIHIRNATGISVKPEKLQTKYSTYASFCIRCDVKLRNTLMDANVWPSGSLVKQFYE